mgnify:CR=1 FL=1
MRPLRRCWKLAIYRGSEGVQQFGPSWVPKPERATADPTEIAAPWANFAITQIRLIGGNILLALDFQGLCFAPEIDGVSATTGCLAADRAIAMIERIRVFGLEREPHPATMTGTFEFHQMPSLFVSQMKTGPLRRERAGSLDAS